MATYGDSGAGSHGSRLAAASRSIISVVCLTSACAFAQNSASKIPPYPPQPSRTSVQQTITRHQLLAPAKAQHAIEKATAAIQLGNTTEAQKHLARALSAYPDYSVALTMRGCLAANDGKLAEASADLERAIEVDPGYGAPYIALASLENDAHSYESASRLLARGAPLIPGAWQTHVELARALYGKNGDKTIVLREIGEAETIARRLATSAQLSYIHRLKGRILIELEDYPQARSALEESLQEEPNSDTAEVSKKIIEQLRALESGGQ